MSSPHRPDRPATATTAIAATGRTGTRRPTARGLGGLVVAIVLAAGACSGSDTVDTGASGPSGPSGSAPVSLAGNVADHGEQTVSGPTPTVDLELDDSYFAPTFVRADPGAVVTVELENEGGKVHTFTLDDHHVDVSVEPGASAKVDVTMPASGSLHWFCQIHSGAGMQGSFVVDGGSSAPTTTAPTATAPAVPTTESGSSY
jgi:plastocyanin